MDQLSSKNCWRKDYLGGTEKLKYIVQEGLFTDVSFRVSNDTGNEVEIIKAHRWLLVMFSQVFQVMFEGDFLENTPASREPIDVPDIEPVAFKAMLKFLSDESFDKDLSASTLCAILYAARKYDILELETECLRLLREKLSTENAITVFQAAQLFSDTDLEQHSDKFIRTNFGDVMKGPDFSRISLENLSLFLEDDNLKASEMGIFNGVLRWAKFQCLEQGVEQTPENQRNAIGEFLHLIRFPTIPAHEIAMKVIPSGMLTASEALHLCQFKLANASDRSELPPLPYKNQPRRHRIFNYVAKFPHVVEYVQEQEFFESFNNELQVDKPISIKSFGFHGPRSSSGAEYTVEMRIENASESNECLGEATHHGVALKRDQIIHVPFLKPVLLNPENKYHVSFCLKGPSTTWDRYMCSQFIIPVSVSTQCPGETVRFTYSCAAGSSPQLGAIGFNLI